MGPPRLCAPALLAAAAAASAGGSEPRDPGGLPQWLYPEPRPAKAAESPPEGGGAAADGAAAEEAPYPPLRAPRAVRFVGTLPGDAYCFPGTVPFRTQQGAAYRCCLRRPQESDSENAGKEQRGAGGSEAQAAAQSAAARAELLAADQVPGVDAAVTRALPTTCLSWAAGGWWTYELCISKWVRQYHQDDGVTQSEYVLGLGRDALADDTAGNREIQYVDGAYSLLSKLKKSLGSAVSATGQWRIGIEKEGEADRYFFQTQYLDGLRCDVSGEPRVTELRAYCAADEQNLKFNVTEVSTCKYVARLYLDALCSLPQYRTVAGGVHPREGPDDLGRLSATERKQLIDKKRTELEDGAPVPGVDEVMSKSIGGKWCVVAQTDGWWTYELCPRHWLRQYREEESVIQSDFVLGLGQDAFKESPITKRKVKYRDGERALLAQLRKELQAPQADGVWTVGREGSGESDMHGAEGKYYFKTQLTDGLMCDLTQRPRETELRLYCLEEREMVVFNVSEVASCKYVARVFAKPVCSFKPYRYLTYDEPARSKPDPAVTLLCAPEGTAADGTAGDAAAQQPAAAERPDTLRPLVLDPLRPPFARHLTAHAGG
eukprot:TRINITY_DN70880_c0_g1_i1.p1 TRINITY_DN70880_c0_g1~~TRINITY_DN70880_c0_g1_i1.p1  ORF type:complete len:603 (+),score=198.35 TRINITY_DN70880_c0_g1_i1:76-1884(+)